MKATTATATPAAVANIATRSNPLADLALVLVINGVRGLL